MLLDGEAIPEHDVHGRRIVGDTLLVVINTSDADVEFAMPVVHGSRWRCEIDTMDPAGAVSRGQIGERWMLRARSSAVFVAERRGLRLGA